MLLVLRWPGRPWHWTLETKGVQSVSLLARQVIEGWSLVLEPLLTQDRGLTFGLALCLRLGPFSRQAGLVSRLGFCRP